MLTEMVKHLALQIKLLRLPGKQEKGIRASIHRKLQKEIPLLEENEKKVKDPIGHPIKKRNFPKFYCKAAMPQ